MLQFTYAIPDPGSHQEFKRDNFNASFDCSADLKCKSGQIKAPPVHVMEIDIGQQQLNKSQVINGC